MQFHETAMGRNFYERHVPELIKQLTRIATALEENNTSVIDAVKKDKGADDTHG